MIGHLLVAYLAWIKQWLNKSTKKHDQSERKSFGYSYMNFFFFFLVIFDKRKKTICVKFNHWSSSLGCFLKCFGKCKWMNVTRTHTHMGAIKSFFLNIHSAMTTTENALGFLIFLKKNVAIFFYLNLCVWYRKKIIVRYVCLPDLHRMKWNERRDRYLLICSGCCDKQEKKRSLISRILNTINPKRRREKNWQL